MYVIDKYRTAIILLCGVVCVSCIWWRMTNDASKLADALGIISAGLGITTLILTYTISANPDLPKIRLYGMAFDRPAFRTSFVNEISQENFAIAVDQTSEAIRTGAIRNRDGDIIHKIDLGGRHSLTKWAGEMDDVTVALERLKTTYRTGLAEGKFRTFEHGKAHYLPDVDKAFGDYMDDLKIDALKKMNVVLAKAKLNLLSLELDRDKSRPR
jgi:hypothetical protein